jgi:hypothetical protein
MDEKDMSQAVITITEVSNRTRSIKEWSSIVRNSKLHRFTIQANIIMETIRVKPIGPATGAQASNPRLPQAMGRTCSPAHARGKQ